MYADVAYVNEKNDMTQPLSVKSCGYYRIYNLKSTTSERPSGRSDFQLLYVASGKTHFFFNGKEILLSEGSFVLYRPKQPQKYTYYAHDKPEVFWVHFSGNEAEDILKRYGLGDQTVFQTTPSNDLKNLFFLLIHESQQLEPHYNRLAPLLLRSIFLLAAKGFSQNSEDIDQPILPTVQGNNPQHEVTRAIQYFNAHYMDDINIEKYATENHMSPCWFIRSFRKHIGVTPRQHIISARITHAQSLLENTEMSISEISSTIGYDDSRYFCRIFKKQTGLSPLEYRKTRI